MNYYNKADILDIKSEILGNGNFSLFLRTKLETLFFLSGAKLRREENAIILNLVRCSISKECPVDIKAKVTRGLTHPYTIVLEVGDLALILEDDDGRRHVLK